MNDADEITDAEFVQGLFDILSDTIDDGLDQLSPFSNVVVPTPEPHPLQPMEFQYVGTVKSDDDNEALQFIKQPKLSQQQQLQLPKGNQGGYSDEITVETEPATETDTSKENNDITMNDVGNHTPTSEMTSNSDDHSEKNPNVVYFGGRDHITHQANKKYRDVIKKHALKAGAEWSDDAYQQVMRELKIEGISKYMVAQKKGVKRSFRDATPQEISDNTKSKWTDAKKAQRRKKKAKTPPAQYLPSSPISDSTPENPPFAERPNPNDRTIIQQHPPVPLESSCPKAEDVCLDFNYHPGTIKWRNAVAIYSDNSKLYPKWNDYLSELIERTLFEDDPGVFWHFRDVHNKPCKCIEDGLWVQATPEDVIQMNKERFERNRSFKDPPPDSDSKAGANHHHSGRSNPTDDSSGGSSSNQGNQQGPVSGLLDGQSGAAFRDCCVASSNDDCMSNEEEEQEYDDDDDDDDQMLYGNCPIDDNEGIDPIAYFPTTPQGMQIACSSNATDDTSSFLSGTFRTEKPDQGQGAENLPTALACRPSSQGDRAVDPPGDRIVPPRDLLDPPVARIVYPPDFFHDNEMVAVTRCLAKVNAETKEETTDGHENEAREFMIIEEMFESMQIACRSNARDGNRWSLLNNNCQTDEPDNGDEEEPPHIFPHRRCIPTQADKIDIFELPTASEMELLTNSPTAVPPPLLPDGQHIFIMATEGLHYNVGDRISHGWSSKDASIPVPPKLLLTSLDNTELTSSSTTSWNETNRRRTGMFHYIGRTLISKIPTRLWKR